MREDPEFRITLPDIVTTEFLEEVQDTKVSEFIKGEEGYFTLDFSYTKQIDQKAVRNIEEIAYDVGEEGILQCINVGRKAWYPLINTNIGGGRLIFLAEIYTKRTPRDLLDFFENISKRSVSLGLAASYMHAMKSESQKEFKKLHGTKEEYCGFGGYDKKLAEFKLITAQRWIEQAKGNPNISAHLGYRYGWIKHITPIDKIPNLLEPPLVEEVLFYERYPEGSLCQGVYQDWRTKHRHGWLGLDGVSVSVHFSDIDMPGFKRLHEGKWYDFKIHHSKKGPKALEVTPYKNF